MTAAETAASQRTRSSRRGASAVAARQSQVVQTGATSATALADPRAGKAGVTVPRGANIVFLDCVGVEPEILARQAEADRAARTKPLVVALGPSADVQPPPSRAPEALAQKP